MSYESEANKEWDKKPIYSKLGFIGACIGLMLLLFPLAIGVGIKERIFGIKRA